MRSLGASGFNEKSRKHYLKENQFLIGWQIKGAKIELESYKENQTFAQKRLNTWNVYERFLEWETCAYL